ncbi:hypothetical protein CMT41_07355 [Colwellia sp. MT41]|uniref:Sigma-70 family RNA polymerase sigma factor n=1 Tax=Colwellia marinimaniae TaxID=1513592 RepID=A0ABQ0MZR1_9GAMM|nr:MULTISPECIES: sigma-70 family RNA polymerase sigma factor [Colwellia]ALO34552.1 hypothetical protein CMT41_07355 [Colwellia sp. MT41]GAW97857.1 hypothetical protein MTCD1_03505 [Colwellia marinimaniae]
MGANNKEIAKYLLLIKKITAWKIKSPDHKYLVDDVVQEVFLKLFKQNFFDENKFESEDDRKMITSYIRRTVHSCYLDQLIVLGFIRRLTKAERLSLVGPYENIKKKKIEDTCEGDIALPPIESPEQYIFVKEAYQWIKSCFDKLLLNISNFDRQKFFEAAFWDFNEYDLPLNKLAVHIGYSSSNPTQELKRFIDKISLCTQPHGVVVTNPHEQIQFLRELIAHSEERT